MKGAMLDLRETGTIDHGEAEDFVMFLLPHPLASKYRRVPGIPSFSVVDADSYARVTFKGRAVPT
jgi:hypothetical protein